jgi:hypothetical protein
MDHILPSYWSSGLRTTTANRKAESLFNHVSPQLHVSAHGVTQLTMLQPRRSCLHFENMYRKRPGSRGTDWLVATCSSTILTSKLPCRLKLQTFAAGLSSINAEVFETRVAKA